MSWCKFLQRSNSSGLVIFVFFVFVLFFLVPPVLFLHLLQYYLIETLDSLMKPWRDERRILYFR